MSTQNRGTLMFTNVNGIIRRWTGIPLFFLGILVAHAFAMPAASASIPSNHCYATIPANSYQECYLGPFMVQEPAGRNAPLNDFVVTDPHNAPQLWQGVGGLYEGDAPMCSQDSTLIQSVACLGGYENRLSQPIIVLYSHGKPYVITVRDIIRMHNRGILSCNRPHARIK